jgi:hypothetical protein
MPISRRRPPLPLNDVQRHALARVGMAELMRREPASDTGPGWRGAGARRGRRALATRTDPRRGRDRARSARAPRQLGHVNLGTTSIYLQGIDTEKILATVHARRPPMMSETAGLRL